MVLDSLVAVVLLMPATAKVVRDREPNTVQVHVFLVCDQFRGVEAALPPAYDPRGNPHRYGRRQHPADSAYHRVGVTHQGTKAKAGEAWVHDGSLWIAKKDTPAKPETAGEDWVIAARKGRDGERGPKGKDAIPEAPIKLKDQA